MGRTENISLEQFFWSIIKENNGYDFVGFLSTKMLLFSLSWVINRLDAFAELVHFATQTVW